VHVPRGAPDARGAPSFRAGAIRAKGTDMIRPTPLLAAAVLAAAGLVSALPAHAQDKPPTAIVSLYRVAPGKHLDFLKWMAAREGIDHDLGIAATQWYAHTNGDSWDYVAIAPDLDPATSDRQDAEAKKRGLTTGMKASLEFRSMIATHTDTFVVGPFSATQLVQDAGK